MSDADAAGSAAGITDLLVAWREGDEEAPRTLFALLYQEPTRFA